MFASHLLPNISSFAAGHLTKRALYKMYEITGSCRRWPRMSRPLMSSVTEPPLHSWKGERETPVTRPSLTAPDYDSWGELAHTHKREEAMQRHAAAWQHRRCRQVAVTNWGSFQYYLNIKGFHLGHRVLRVLNILVIIKLDGCDKKELKVPCGVQTKGNEDISTSVLLTKTHWVYPSGLIMC